jgi:signal transduction histidine kinase
MPGCQADRSIYIYAQKMPDSRTVSEDVADAPGSSSGLGPGFSGFLLHTCHDLKSSLRAIRLHAQIAAKEREAGEVANLGQHLDAIVEDSGKLELLANGLVSYAIACQIDESSLVTVPAEVMLRTVLARLGHELSQNGAEVTYVPLPRIRCDPDRLQQVFENLVRNAIIHCGPTAPRLYIRAQEQGEMWLFSVRDNGPGIEAAYLASIFEPFKRLSGHRAAGPGLGLTICREIVERHGGQMWAESEAGAGLTVFFTLPGTPNTSVCATPGG